MARVARPKILIVFGYHPKETFAIKVGEYLLQNNKNPDIKIIKYTGKPDRKTSTYNLRSFIKNFNPVISAIILHDDPDAEFEGAIVYSAKSKKERRKALKPLLDFALRCDGLIAMGRFLTPNTKCSFIDLELNPKKGLKKAIDLVKNFSEYLLNLYFEHKLRL